MVSQPKRRSTASAPKRRRVCRVRKSSGAVSSQAESLRALDLSTALQLAALVESSDDAVIVLSLQGLIATWSEGAERLFGYSQTEAVNPVPVLGEVVPQEKPTRQQDTQGRRQQGTSRSRLHAADQIGRHSRGLPRLARGLALLLKV